MEQGELQEKGVEKNFPPLKESEKYGNFLPVGDGIWLRYEDLRRSFLYNNCYYKYHYNMHN